MMIKIENQTDFPLPIETLERVARSLTDREIELVVCGDDAIRKLNALHRSKDHPTDVLSFPLEGDFKMMPLGSIVISSDTIHRKAEELGHTAQEESILLFLHGLLHLLGYDHECDRGEMRAREEAVIRSFGLPDSLIVRTEKEEE